MERGAGTERGPQPVLCFLHGYGEGAPLGMEEALRRHGPLRAGNPRRALEQFIIVAPQLPVRGDIWLRYAEPVREVVAKVQDELGGDPARTSVDPTRVPERLPAAPIWLSIGEAARHSAGRFIDTLGLRPLGADAGLERVFLDEGADHVGSARLAYRDERIYAWLLSRQLLSN